MLAKLKGFFLHKKVCEQNTSMEEEEFDMDAPLSQLLVRKRKARKKESQASSSRSPEVANNLEHAPPLATSKNGMDAPSSRSHEVANNLEHAPSLATSKNGMDALSSLSPEVANDPEHAPCLATEKNGIDAPSSRSSGVADNPEHALLLATSENGINAPSSRSTDVANNPEHAPFLAISKNGMGAPLSQAFKQKRKSRMKESPAMADKAPVASNNAEDASFPATTISFNANPPPDILVSKFNYSVQSHLKDIDTISKLCRYPETVNVNHPEIKRLSSTTTFLREWSDFKYAPRVVKFACQHNSKEKEVMGEVILPQFSAASVPKETQDGGGAGTESRDFVMHVGGVVWALDWCPRVDDNSENHIKSEFIAVAAHPPESSYHKIGVPLTGRGIIQIWCFPTVHMKEGIPSQGSKRSKSNSQKKGMCKSNETPIPSQGSKRSKSNSRKTGMLKSTETPKVPRPKGRPRKKPVDDSVEEVDTNSLNVQPLSVEYPEGSNMFNSPHGTSARTFKHVYSEDSVRTQIEHADMLLLTAPEVGQNQLEAEKDQVPNNGVHIPRPCELGESAVVNRITSSSIGLDSISHDNNVTCTGSVDASTSSNSIPLDVSLPRMMLCLAHNGKVAWDVKWRPVNAFDPESTSIMGYLAVLLGNGALEVWEVPCPHTVKHLYPVGQKQTDPRFVKLQPVFRCSMLKFGNRQSIPLTVEWSVSSPNDMILAGCHDGVVALWKFLVTDSLTETKPLLSFSADIGPIRTLAWAPAQSDPESANIIVTAGYKGFKFWDIRDPFRPLWDYPLQGVTLGLNWLPDPRCVFGSFDDGTMWLLSLTRAALDIPITGKASIVPKPGFHIYLCSSFAIWSLQASQMTGMVAYCGEDGTTFCFKPTTRSVRDPSRQHADHWLCGSLLEEDSAIIVATPSANSSHRKRTPNLKRSGSVMNLEKAFKHRTEQDKKALALCNGSEPTKEHESNKSLAVIGKQAQKTKESSNKKSAAEEFEVFPPKSVALHKVRWNVNKGREKWLCYGGAAGLVRCHEVNFSHFE